MRIRNRREPEKCKLELTSMIDIVFLLLIFFVMTFTVVEMEGDFNIASLPVDADGNPDDVNNLPPLTVRLKANSLGDLAGIELDGRSFKNMNDLHSHVMALAGGGEGPGTADIEAEFDCDYKLKYSNVVEAITAVSGTVGENGEVVKLIEKIKFAPPKKPVG